MHSARDPAREAERFADELLARAPEGLCLVVGLGWGYAAVALAARLGRAELSERFLFFEPIDSAGPLLENAGRLAELRDAGARIIPGDIGELRRALAGARASIEILPVYRRLWPDLAAQVAATLGGPAGAADVDRSTALRFVRQWTRNAILRLVDSETLRFASAPAPEATDAPDDAQSSLSRPPLAALYCGAGPNLLAELAPLRTRLESAERPLFVLAADSALGPLYQAGVVPDLILSVDSGPGTYLHFLAALRNGAAAPLAPPVLAWLAAAPTLERLCAQTIFFRSSAPLDQLLGAGVLGIAPEWRNPARNLAGLALEAAARAGARILYLAGADFQTHGGLSHAPGGGYTEHALLRASRTTPLADYRPRGYSETLTRKNETARAGLNDRARELNITLRPLASDAARLAKNPNSPRPDWAAALGTVDIECRRLRRDLAALRPRLDWRELATLGLSRSAFERLLARLGDG